MEQAQSNRRRFIAAALWAGGGSLLALNVPAVLAAGEAAARQLEEGAPLAKLSPAEARTLGAVADQVIPPDDLPGATQAGVVYFIDNVLSDFMAGAASLLQQGAADLDRAAVEAYGLAADPRLVAWGRHVYDGGLAAMREILSSGVSFSAVLASNDESALGARSKEQALKFIDGYYAVIDDPERRERALKCRALH